MPQSESALLAILERMARQPGGGDAALLAHLARLALESAHRREHMARLWDRLAPREQEAARLVAAGLTNSQVASRLTITRGSVKSLVWRALRKLGLRSRSELRTVVQALEGEPAHPLNPDA